MRRSEQINRMIDRLAHAPPLETFVLSITPAVIGPFIATLDELSFLNWTIHSTGSSVTEVEITFNQFCQPVTDQSVVSAKGFAQSEIGTEV